MKLTIEKMKELARERGGLCLSTEYVNAKTKLTWQCANGHQWEATHANIKQGRWCPHCRNSALALSIEEMHEIATKRGGQCISQQYVNGKTKLAWECSEGHRWKATPAKVKSRQWCPFCAPTKRGTIEELQNIAAERGGKCLSQKYKGAHSLLLFECSEGHQWKANPSNIKSGTWCPHCRGKAPLTLDHACKLAAERGGECLSNEFVDTKSKLLWKCAHGHKWQANYNNISIGKWCPECSTGLGERICRTVFEQIFNYKFEKGHPAWLVNNRGNQMELDGFNEEMGLAFEHHGRQHYEHVSHYHKKDDALRIRKSDDKLRRQLCATHGVVLIEIPELFTITPLDQLADYINEQCAKNKVPMPEGWDNIEFVLKGAYSSTSSVVMLEEMKQLAIERNGRCLSDVYVNNSIELLWECSEGHRWEAAPKNIKGLGRWCPYCAKNRKLDIDDMKQLAIERNGRCLSNVYINSKTKLLWECAEGHQWEAVPSGVKKGTWCPHCAGRRPSIDKMRAIAKERGGKCLSGSYKNAQTKLLWECSEGHRWEAVPHHIKQGTWCPHCSKQRVFNSQRLSIETMHVVAKERGGKCLSTVYVNARTKLLWECAEGHQWEATPDKIRSGRWCPLCRKRSRR